ncbi:MAG TPA: hypothetical protein VKK19_07000 [Candidatus Dormibacteraeota bacterium]|nr:hypothetical protein [Candidatus Dormibacteraeota bacterium]
MNGMDMGVATKLGSIGIFVALYVSMRADAIVDAGAYLMGITKPAGARVDARFGDSA